MILHNVKEKLLGDALAEIAFIQKSGQIITKKIM